MDYRPTFYKYQQWYLLAGLIILAIFFRSLHFPVSFNFSSDQGAFSITALQQWQEKELALQGPPFSFKIGERQVAQGPAIYYLQILFLLLGSFDPLLSSLAFSLFSCLMIVPLYLGSKLLLNQKGAWILSIIFALTPFYITYTKFLWNPNYQLAFLPVLILLMGLYKKNNSKKLFFSIGLLTFFLLQLHYQFFIGLIGIVGFYLVNKTPFIKWSLFLLGGIIAYLPFLYYEITHHWYNTDTLWFFLTHRDILFAQNKDQSSFAPHYYLSLSFLAVIMIVALSKKYLSKYLIISVLVFLVSASAYYFLPLPKGAYGMAENWNYLDEAKVHQIIMTQKLDSFNVTNLEYDSLSYVQKYLLLKDQYPVDLSNYYNNHYLFVVSKKPDLFSYPAYEIQSFASSREINKWPINEQYILYLLERI